MDGAEQLDGADPTSPGVWSWRDTSLGLAGRLISMPFGAQADEDEGAAVIPKKVAAFWFVVLLAASILIFRSGAADTSWLVSGVGYLCGLLSFGALLELLKRNKPAVHRAPAIQELKQDARRHGVSLKQLAAMPQGVMQIVETFGQLMERTPCQVRPESMLPYPKPVIEKALQTALSTLTDPESQHALRAALSELDTFIPDHQVPQDPNERAIEYIRCLGHRAKADGTK